MKKQDSEVVRDTMDNAECKKVGLSIVYQDLNGFVLADEFCLSLWKTTMPEWISKELREDMEEALKGYDKDTALEIADNLVDCWSRGSLHVTGLKYVDELLGKFYMRILSCAHCRGIDLTRRK